MNKIKLFNRYGTKLFLEKVYDKTYLLNSENKDDLMHMSIHMYNEDEAHDLTDVLGVDPSGGPFIYVGYFRIGDAVVDRIYWSAEDKKYCIHFSEEIKNIDPNTLY